MTIYRRTTLFLLGLALAVGASQAMAAEIHLAWNAPTVNCDGSPLRDLAGHVVYYGTASGDYQTGVDVGLETQATLTGLQAGVTYYVVVEAYNSWSYPGELSQEIVVATPISTQADADMDNMPDAWELANFGSLSSVNGGPDEDYDADGFANLEEYVAGTSPADASSGPFVSLDIVRKYLNVTFQALKADAGTQRYYALERADSPTASTWTAVTGYGRVLGQNQLVTYVERSRKRWYYRLNIWLE